MAIARELAHAAKATGEDIHIVRRAKCYCLPAWHWHSLQDLEQQLGWKDAAQECLFADLSMGAWRGHWLAREWGAQLGLDAPQDIQPVLYTDSELASHYADTIGRLIDNESEGDRNFISALQFARKLIARFLAQGISQLFVVAPIRNAAWGAENVQLLKLLCDAALVYDFKLGLLLRADALQIAHLPGFEIFPQNQAARLPKITTTCAIPGIIDAALLQATLINVSKIDCLQLANGRILISPNIRPFAEDQKMSVVEQLEPHLQVCFALQSAQQDVYFLQQQAGLRFAEGAYELAFAILDGIDGTHLSPLQAALIEAQKQNISIALMDFERAAEGVLPDDSLPNVIKASLYQSKAWGLVMIGQAKNAEPYFELARQYLDPQIYRRLYLYLLNISALNKFRLGQVEQALAFEKEIEKQLTQIPRPDWHLIYINCLNMARIFKKQRDFEQAYQYYQRGFFVNFHLRNESDLLYINLCFAQIEFLRERHEQSFVHWLRACIHWLSNPIPEALAPRVAQAVLGGPLSNKKADVEEISATLGEELLRAANALGCQFSLAVRSIPFHRICAKQQADVCIAQPGWSLMLGHHAHAPQPFTGPAYMRLNQLLVGLLASLVPQVDFTHIQCVLSDHQCGIELPTNPRAVLWSCLKWQIPQLWYEGRYYHFTYEQDEFRKTLIGDFMVEKSRAIDYVRTDHVPWQVHFKRYFHSLDLNMYEQQCMEQLQQPMTLAQLSHILQRDTLSCMHLVNEMAEKRLLLIT